MVRVMRDSPPDDARAFAGPAASTSSTRWPAWRRCQAVQAPKTPAPTTIVSQSFAAAPARRAAADSATAPAAFRTSRRVTPSPAVIASVRADQATEAVRVGRLRERPTRRAEALACAAAAAAARRERQRLAERALGRVAQQVVEVVGGRAVGREAAEVVALVGGVADRERDR